MSDLRRRPLSRGSQLMGVNGGVHQVAGAREAAMMGVPAISVSLCDYRATTVAAYT